MASVVLVTGLSGAGKSTVLNVLEDLGFFSMDSLPIVLLPKVLELAGTQEPIDKIAVGLDGREPAFIQDAGGVIARLRQAGSYVQLIYVDAEDDILRQRYNETRRKHPLDKDGDLSAAISRERAVLMPLREIADLVLDTTHYRVPQLQHVVRDMFQDGLDDHMHLRLVSFGFKHGITPEADLLFDVRFIQNPFFEEDLRPLSGMDTAVQRYVFGQQNGQEFLARVHQLLAFLLPRYEDTGRAYLTVAVGCTGGQHRSVAVVEALATSLRRDGWKPTVAHREAHRWPG